MNKLIEGKLRRLIQKEIKSVLKENVIDRKFLFTTLKELKLKIDGSNEILFESLKQYPGLYMDFAKKNGCMETRY